MLKLCGFALSNYYNKVKLVLLEKDIPFEEVYVQIGAEDETPWKSATGKIPYIEIRDETLCESEVIVEYLEARWPTPRLLPEDPWSAAKVRELITVLELHLELIARKIYPAAFMGQTLPPEVISSTTRELQVKIAGFSRLTRFDPYIAGEEFTLADCAAFVHLPLIAMATRAVTGHDLLTDGGIRWRDHARMISRRPAAMRVSVDQRAKMSRGARMMKAV